MPDGGILFSIAVGGIGTLEVTVGMVAVAAITVGTVVYSQSQAAAMKKKVAAALANSRGTTLTSRDPVAQRRVIYGHVRTGGTIVFMHATNSPGGSSNEYLHMVIALAGHEVEAIGDIYFDEAIVPLDGSGECVTGTFAGKVRVKKFLGTDSQAACAELMADAPDKWTSAHQLRGITYLYVRLTYDPNVFSGLPNVSAMVDGKKLYDPRDGQTRFSSNPALVIRDFLTNTDHGLGAAADELDEASIIAKANLCDETVGIVGGGVEPRYTINGSYTREAQPSALLNELAGAMAGAIIYTGGFWNLAGGCYETPSADFSWGDFRGAVTLQTADSRRDTANAVKGTYLSEKNNWQPSDYPPVKNATYSTEDGERIWRELDLPYTTSSAAAQRLAKIELERARQDITLKLPLTLKGLRVKAGDVVTLTLDRYGWTAKPFEVMNWRFVTDVGGGGDQGGPVLGVDIELRETAPGVWDWNSGEETTVDLAPNTLLPDFRGRQAPRTPVLTSSASVAPDGTTTSQLILTWLPPLDSQSASSAGKIEVQYKLAAASDWIGAGSLPGDTTSTAIPGQTPGMAYHARLRSVNGLGVASVWIVTSSCTAAGDDAAPGEPTGAAAAGIYKGARVVWVNPADADLAYVEAFEASASTPAPTAGSVGMGRIYGTDYVRQGLAAADVRWYWVRAVDASGNKSAWVSAGSATASAIDTTGIFPITSTQITDGEVTTPKLAASSVTAEKVGANEIISTSANIGMAVIKGANIENLAVDTLQIKGNAVTIPVSAYTATEIYAPNHNLTQVDGIWIDLGTTLQSATIISTGAPIMITFGGVFYAGSDTYNGNFFTVRLYRGSFLLFELGGIGRTYPESFSFTLSDTATSGAVTYTMNGYGSYVDATAANRSIVLIETKK